MDQAEAKKKIDALTAELKEHNYRYYVLSEPTISDFEFDHKLKELAYLEQQYPGLAHDDSPTKVVGGGVQNEFKTIKHRRPMLSLGNTYNDQELRDFDARVKKAIGHEVEYVCELKIDGLAISLFYENGKLKQAITRGDGVQGDDVTANVRTIRSLATTLHGQFPESFEIRGEIFMHRKGFEKLNQERQLQGEPAYANPRNVASGSLKLKDPAEVAKRPLDITLYHLLGDNLPFDTHHHCIQAAKSWGLKTADTTEVCKGIDEVLVFLKKWDEKRHHLGFDTDGVVIKVNNLALHDELGYTAKVPRWAIAYKFQTETTSTRLLGITYQVGRTGAITPVAELQPVLLLGTTVKRASLHNANEIGRLDVRVGDMVFVEKGGEIIPKITGIDFSQRPADSEPTSYITHCPVCHTALIRNEGEAKHFCPNEDGCPPQIKGKIEHFAGRKAMDIEGLGSETVELLFNSMLIGNIADVYDLTKPQVMQLDRMADQSAQNLIDGIAASAQIPFERVLFALGIRYVGETVAKKLAYNFKTIEAIEVASFEELNAVNEIGAVIARSLRDWLDNPKHIDILARLKAAGLQFTLSEDKMQPASDKLAGLTFVVSGTFANYSRDGIKETIERNGGKVSGSVSGKTSYVVAGNDMGPSKLEKAQKLGVKIISEEEFTSMLS
jgi:DNA ligase (NAD+)